MAKNLIPVLFMFLVLTHSCSKESQPKIETFAPINYDTISFYPSIKGWEVYSWPNGDTWNFSLLPGTNRLKSYAEVMEGPFRVSGLQALKELFAKLPAEEELILIGEDWLAQIWGEPYYDLQLPPLFVVMQVKQMGEHLGHSVWLSDEQ